jgi:hypothetical protein
MRDRATISAIDGRAVCSAHDVRGPTTPADAPPRESIEVRTQVFRKR